jgi:hypothetical protein
MRLDHPRSQDYRHSPRVHTPDTERRPLPPGHGCTRTGCSR